MKLALVLGGGGANGSYQVGVLKALLEENLLKDLKIIAGTSIGALNGSLIQGGFTYEQIVQVWEMIDKDLLYRNSHDLESNEYLGDFGIYNQQEMYQLVTEKIKVTKITKSNIKGFVTVTRVNNRETIKVKKKSRFEKKYIYLNDKENPFPYILASTAIPIVFKPVVIDEVSYVDGGLLDNLPVTVAVEEKANVIIVVGLRPGYKLDKYHDDNLILNFSPYKRIALTFLSHLDFSESHLTTNLERGYHEAIHFIRELEKAGVIKDGVIDKDYKGLYQLNKKYELEKSE